MYILHLTLKTVQTFCSRIILIIVTRSPKVFRKELQCYKLTSGYNKVPHIVEIDGLIVNILVMPVCAFLTIHKSRFSDKFHISRASTPGIDIACLFEADFAIWLHLH